MAEERRGGGAHVTPLRAALTGITRVTPLTHWEGEPVGVWARLWGIPTFEAHDTLTSTNDRARELARDGAGLWTAVVAERQSAGRGRNGRVWHSPPETGLWISLLVPGAEAAGGSIPLIVGLGAARALEQVTGATVGVKWPNDLWVGGRKVAGILCEGVRSAVVVGVGVNVGGVPDDLPDDVAAVTAGLAEAAGGAPVARSAIAGALVRHLKTLMASDRSGLGDDLLAELARRDVLRGREVETSCGVGVAEGIDSEGALLLARPDGRRARVVAGSVRLVGPPHPNPRS